MGLLSGRYSQEPPQEEEAMDQEPKPPKVCSRALNSSPTYSCVGGHGGHLKSHVWN